MGECIGSSVAGEPVENPPGEFASRAFVWGVLRAGDCEQSNGRIEFRTDDSGTWSCTTRTFSTSTGDIWHARFTVRNAGGLTLFETPTFDSPEMDDGNPPPLYHWSREFIYDSSIFNEIAGVVQHYSC
ncbi:DUF6294 family protein [Streptomyces roseifaciens]|uniref:DUF6294 family protein n=1 Tax=Streptomyces roseifaciens TaxID=1488406 RepID=UPI0007C86049|nr:DUF6294 family protein [Streptomyces roseifaciens]